MAVKILIADDHEIVRQGIRRVLEVKPEWEICAKPPMARKPSAWPRSFLPTL